MGLEEQEQHVYFFRASFDLGHAVEKHRADLSEALKKDRRAGIQRDLFRHLLQTSRDWLDVHVGMLAHKDYDGHIAMLCDNIHNQAKHATKSLQRAYQSVANAVSASSPQQLTRHLEVHAGHARELVGTSIKRFGGARATLRWSSCRRAALRFLVREDITRCSFERGRNDFITVHIGDHLDSARHPQKGALRTYYCFLFYFFHEYMSHSFAEWQHGDFVDGYLVWAEKRVFASTANDGLRDRFVADTVKKHPDNPLAYTEGVADWFAGISRNDRFVRFLLEWAAEVAAEVERDEHHATLEALQYLADQLSVRRLSTSPQLAALARAFDDDDSEEVRKRICAIAQRVGGFPPNHESLL